MAEVILAGQVAYAAAWEMQKDLLERRIAGEIGDVVLVCEHDPVYTVGRRRGAEGNLLDVDGVPVYEVERGGDVTWHGPGQLVAYPILALHGEARDLHRWLRRLEDLLIAVCADFGLAAGRDPRNTGAWIGGRKVGSVGIACRRWVTWHGISLNVNPDLAWFARINPCGLDAALVTTMEAELGRPVEMAAVQAALAARVRDW